jgi:hypothetical protein
VFWKLRNRFFFGCNASTAEKRCPGPKVWQSIDVPDELRVDPCAPAAADVPKTDMAVKRERSSGEAGASAHSESSEAEAEASEKVAKRECS